MSIWLLTASKVFPDCEKRASAMAVEAQKTGTRGMASESLGATTVRREELILEPWR